MARTGFSTTDLQQLEGQLTLWRRSRRGRRRLPEAVWEAAAQLAATHGLSRVARSLHLDYHKLQRCLARLRTPATGNPTPTFVEIPWMQPHPAPGSLACRVELRNEHGATMTLHLPGDTATVVALVDTFWRRS